MLESDYFVPLEDTFSMRCPPHDDRRHLRPTVRFRTFVGSLLTVIAISTAALVYNRAWTTLQGAEWGTRERNWITGQVRECHRSGCKYQVRVKCTEVELAQDREERAKPGLIKLTMCGDGGYRYEDR